MDHIITLILILAWTLYRPWIGGFFAVRTDQGGVFKSPNALTKFSRVAQEFEVPVGLLLAAFTLYVDRAPTWTLIYVPLAVWALWKWSPHGSMLSFPLRSDRDDWILTIVDDLFEKRSEVLRHFAYNYIRYSIPVVLLGVPLQVWGDADLTSWAMIGFVIPVAYYISARYVLNKFPFNSNYVAEFTAGLSVGIALVSLY
jgi:hypothetical protein